MGSPSWPVRRAGQICWCNVLEFCGRLRRANRRDLEQGCRQLRGYHYQIVLRKLQALSGHPRRLHVWTRAAIEMAAKYA